MYGWTANEAISIGNKLDIFFQSHSFRKGKIADKSAKKILS